VFAQNLPDKPKKFTQTVSACQKADGNCFLGQERSADGGIHATRDHNVRSVLRNAKKLHRAIQKKRCGMMTSGVVFLHDSAHPHTAGHSRMLQEHFNWELFDHPPYSPDLALSDYHLFTYLKNCLRSQHFSNNEELKEGVKSHRWQTSLTQAYKNLFPDMISASIWEVTMLRSS
jgi:hypothetical protein